MDDNHVLLNGISIIYFFVKPYYSTKMHFNAYSMLF